MAFRADPAGDQFFALRTFRANGTSTATPVWLAEFGGHWYCYTGARSFKVRRIEGNSRVEVARSDFRGEPHGPWATGRARVLTGRERRRATRPLTAKYGAKFRYFTIVMVLGRFRGTGRAVGLELTLDSAP